VLGLETDGGLYFNLVALVVMMVAFRALGIIVLKAAVRKVAK
jgi:hypothetical protein